jgi:hypothetical protein
MQVQHWLSACDKKMKGGEDEVENEREEEEDEERKGNIEMNERRRKKKMRKKGFVLLTNCFRYLTTNNSPIPHIFT